MPEVAIVDMESQDCIWEIFWQRGYPIASPGAGITRKILTMILIFISLIWYGTPVTAPLMRGLAMYVKEYEVHQEQDAVWMGSAMMINKPNSLGKISGSAQAPILTNLVEDMSPKKSKLTCSLQKMIKKYIECHCKVGHPTTDLLHKHINAALEGAFLGMVMDDISIPRHGSKGGDHKAHGNNKM
ncbi:hypothetical protein BDR06DRAFT_966352 [Suillus hirtellus]|nr:hypothetical protein BDR06DRAFT_966352 [Suillus hirtellus]